MYMEGLCSDMQFAVITFYVCCGKQGCAAGKGKFRLDLQLNCAESTQLPLVLNQMNLLFLHGEPLPNILHLFSCRSIFAVSLKERLSEPTSYSTFHHSEGTCCAPDFRAITSISISKTG